ncbi:MAG: hypothetical protein HRT57_06685 [Crocinitomicaceae bacterium]|nr:hypothetical protein [Crocinitomicaceae bacterium]
MNKLVVLLAFLSSVFVASAQLIEEHKLSENLSEISGLELLNDSTLIAVNDGGNKPRLFLLNLKGKVTKIINVLDVKNKDWEDITIDKEHIYIGDIGNNSNKRSNLKIYKIKIEDILKKKEVKAKTIKFNYGEQTAYPPTEDSMFFDAEGMTFYDDSIWVFTKDRSTTPNGYSRIYKIPTTPGTYTVYKSGQAYIGKNGWLTDGVTAVDVYKNHFYILTYNRYIIKKYANGKFTNVSSFKFKSVAQRESIVVLNKASIFVADEKNPLTGPMKLYKIKP